MVSYVKSKLTIAKASAVKQAASRSQQTRIRGNSWQSIRSRILRRDNGLCLTCKSAKRLSAATEVDHRLPLEDGGTNDDANLQSICDECHKTKTAAENSARAGK